MAPANRGSFNCPISVALTRRWRSRPQHQEPTLLRDLAPAIRPATFSEPGRLTSEALLGLFGDRVLLLRKNVGDSRDRPPALALNTERAGRKLHAADILK